MSLDDNIPIPPTIPNFLININVRSWSQPFGSPFYKATAKLSLSGPGQYGAFKAKFLSSPSDPTIPTNTLEISAPGEKTPALIQLNYQMDPKSKVPDLAIIGAYFKRWKKVGDYPVNLGHCFKQFPAVLINRGLTFQTLSPTNESMIFAGTYGTPPPPPYALTAIPLGGAAVIDLMDFTEGHCWFEFVILFQDESANLGGLDPGDENNYTGISHRRE